MEADGPEEVVAEWVAAAAVTNDGMGPTCERGKPGRKQRSIDWRLWALTSQLGCQEHPHQVWYRHACSTVGEGMRSFG